MEFFQRLPVLGIYNPQSAWRWSKLGLRKNACALAADSSLFQPTILSMRPLADSMLGGSDGESNQIEPIRVSLIAHPPADGQANSDHLCSRHHRRPSGFRSHGHPRRKSWS